MAEVKQGVDTCAGCGAAIAGGSAGCQALFEQFSGRDFSDPAYFRTHLLVVDAYALQHPERYCASAKSLAAHLLDLCWLIEQGGDAAVGNVALQHWLN